MLKCDIITRRWYFLLGILFIVGPFNHVFSKNINPCEWINTPNSEVAGFPNGPKKKESQYQIITNINGRYATTVSTTTVTNTANKIEKYTYYAVIPNTAFITGFVMEIDGSNYTSYIAKDEEARKQFQEFVSAGSTEAVRNSQNFSFSVDLKPNSHASFYLKYEELLTKEHGFYSNVVNIYPGRLVDDLRVEVTIKESTKISNLMIPFLHSGTEMENNKESLESHAFVSFDRDKDGVIKSHSIILKMNKTAQRELTRTMKRDEKSGFGGQLNIKYDVGNPKLFGEIIAGNGYFITFFTPKQLPQLTKHIVFVLDTSGSMMGDRIKKLKAAMEKMLNQIHEKDLISLVEFDRVVKVWDLDNSKNNVQYSASKNLEKTNFPKPYIATSDNIKKAINSVKNFKATGGTDMLTALKVGLRLVELGRKIDQIQRKPLIMFLTDGEATVGEKSPERIKAEVSKYNSGLRKATISTLSLGKEADRKLLQSLALHNDGLFKHIYDDKDSDLQIQYFFNTMSVPVLTDIDFNYDSSAVIKLSDTKFPVCYDGSELIVTGQYDVKKKLSPPKIKAHSATGPLEGISFEVFQSKDDISHHWAFANTKQLLDKIKINVNNKVESYKKEVLDMSLKYSFVTSYSSMVFVKPEGKFVLGTKELLRQ